MDQRIAAQDEHVDLELLIESCKPAKKPGRPSHKRQLTEIRNERKVNLQTPDSVLTATNLKSILSIEALNSLPTHYQNQLVKLLPEPDQVTQEDGTLKPSDTALNNEHFARFCTQYLEKLTDNKLSEKAIEQAKLDVSKELARLDPWKLKNLEPIWGKKLVPYNSSDGYNDERIEQHLSDLAEDKQKSKRRRSNKLA